MVFTDPPYNVDYSGGTKSKLKIKNDSMKSVDFYSFLHSFFSAAFNVCKVGAPIYVCHSDSEGINFRTSMVNSGWLYKSCLVWVKNQFVLGRMDYHMRHEPILYGCKPGGPHKWYGARKQDSVIEEMPGLNIEQLESGAELNFSDGLRQVKILVPEYEVVGATDGFDASIWKVDKPLRSADHPTTKPVEIPQRGIRNSSKNGDTVLDPFLGSGSTLVACEQTGRICRGLELDPKYVDVIVKRWQQFTGRLATLDGDGRTFDEISQDRLGNGSN